MLAHDSEHTKRKLSRRSGACEACRDRKVRCEPWNDGPRCIACARSGLLCSLETQVQKKKRAVGVNTVGEMVLSYNAHVPVQLQYVGQFFGSREMSYLALYQRFTHPYTPVITNSMLRDGMNTVDLSSIGVELTEMEICRQYACRSATWGALALGAALVCDDNSVTYLNLAQSYLRQCYDIPCVETLAAYVATCQALYWLGDTATAVRYGAMLDALHADVEEAIPNEVVAAVQSVYAFVYPCVPAGTLLHTPCLEMSVMESLPVRLQVSYLTSVLSNTVEEMVQSGRRMHTHARTELVQQCMAYLTDMLRRLDQVEDSYVGRFSILALMIYMSEQMGESEQCREMIQQLVDILDEHPQLLAIRSMWRTTFLVEKYLQWDLLYERPLQLACQSSEQLLSRLQLLQAKRPQGPFVPLAKESDVNEMVTCEHLLYDVTHVRHAHMYTDTQASSEIDSEGCTDNMSFSNSPGLPLEEEQLVDMAILNCDSLDEAFFELFDDIV